MPITIATMGRFHLTARDWQRVPEPAIHGYSARVKPIRSVTW
jgi:hypothetical protein